MTRHFFNEVNLLCAVRAPRGNHTLHRVAINARVKTNRRKNFSDTCYFNANSEQPFNRRRRHIYRDGLWTIRRDHYCWTCMQHHLRARFLQDGHETFSSKRPTVWVSATFKTNRCFRPQTVTLSRIANGVWREPCTLQRELCGGWGNL